MQKYSMNDIKNWISEAIKFNRGFTADTRYSTACSNIAIAMMKYNEHVDRINMQTNPPNPYR